MKGITKPLVGVIVGSRADFNILKRGLEALRVMGVPYLFEMASPHRSPDRLMTFARNARSRGLEVLICASGGSGAVATFLASQTTIPVIAIPIDSTPLRGEDALFSMVQTPPGIPVATVGINNSENAALLATQILAIKYEKFRAVLEHRRTQLAQRLEVSQKDLIKDYPDLVDPAKTSPSQTGDSDRDTDPGSEDVTPEPGDTPPGGPIRENPIRPGAQLTSNLAPTAKKASLFPTPVPQEPGTVTEDAELFQDAAKNTSLSDHDTIDMELRPAPPSDSDLYPAQMIKKLREELKIDSKESGEVGPEETTEETIDPFANIEFEEKQTAPRLDTKVFQVSNKEPDEDILSHAMMVILEAGIVAFPTDTVYGLAADATNPEAVKRLYEVKGHDAAHKSLSLLIWDQGALDSLVKEVPPEIETILEKYWPGALTVLFYKEPSVLASVTDANSIAVRIPANPVPLSLMRMLQRPLAVINASTGIDPAPVEASEVIDRFSGKIECILDAGKCEASKTSTVLSVISDPFEIIREGAVSTEDLKAALGDKLKD